VSEILKFNSNKQQSITFPETINRINRLLANLNSQKSLNASEINLLKIELKLIQDFMQNHASLFSTVDQTQKESVQQLLNALILKYYPNNISKFEISFIGEDAGNVDSMVFHQMIEGILRIMAHEQINVAKFRFKFSQRGLSLITQYQITNKQLNDEILSEIKSSAKLADGTFEFGKHNEVWVNHLFIPYVLLNSASKKNAA
jgi:hypothetical protein